MSERDSDSFDLDGDFLAESVPTEESIDYDRMLDRVERRTRSSGPAPKRGKAAWSKLEEVLADRKLERELREFDE